MYVYPLRAWGAAALLALVAGCTAARTDTIPPSTAPALAPGTSVVTTGTPASAIATPPPAAAPVVPAAPGAGTSTMPGGPGRMTASETATLVAGNTATGVAADGKAYFAWFAPGGQLRFRQGDFADSGTWRVGPDGSFCTSMARTNGGAEECYYLSRTGSATAVRFERLDGTPVGTFSVLPGNPQAL
jgi:hypothetical protein